MTEPVLITGCGWVSPLGNSSNQVSTAATATASLAGDSTSISSSFRDLSFEKNLFSGWSGVKPISIDLPGQSSVFVPVAPVDFNHSTVHSQSKVPLDRGTAMALCATKDALLAAGLASLKPQPNGSETQSTSLDIEMRMQGVDPTRVGVFWGSGMAGAFSFDQTAEMLYHQHKRVRPTSVVTIMPNSAAAELALLVKAQGTCMTYSCACASSAVAMGEALRALRAGWLDVALVGGSEAMLSPGVLASWNALRVLSPVTADAKNACRPFAKDRSGFALGEGAGAFILERRDHAVKRGITPKLELKGYASNCDASHMTLPDAAGQARAMNAALKDANLSAMDIGYVNAHATATTAGDIAEVESVLEVLGTRVPISSTKAQFGHMLGAAGALEMMVTIKALEHQTLPPNANLTAELVDPGFNLNFVASRGQSAVIRHTLSNSFAFGGTNAVLIASLVG